MLVADLRDLVHLLHHRRVPILPQHAQRSGQIIGSHDDAVDPRNLQDLVQILHALHMLDLQNTPQTFFRIPNVLVHGNGAEAMRPHRAEAPDALGGIQAGGDGLLGRLHRVDHGEDHPVRRHFQNGFHRSRVEIHHPHHGEDIRRCRGLDVAADNFQRKAGVLLINPHHVVADGSKLLHNAGVGVIHAGADRQLAVFDFFLVSFQSCVYHFCSRSSL